MMLEQFFDYKKREGELYKLWEEKEIFSLKKSTDNKNSQKNNYIFSITMPPPNANGELHLGHSYGYAVMDAFGRYNRLKGFKTLLIPGKDHAGIQTQVVFEKILREKGVNTEEITREDFFDQCYEFCIDKSSYMRKQEKTLGISADFDKEVFTLDKKVSEVVFDTFKKLYDEGLVYRGSRIVHWSVFSQTAISDVEIEYKESNGFLWHIKYPLANPTPEISEIVVATTRPETLLGDTAIAVNPEDERYASLIGHKIIVPETNRKISIISDKRIDKSFGSGAVKVTPAHDFTDYEIGIDHNLEQIQVIDKHGKMTDSVPKEYRGLTTAECRKKLVEKLEKTGNIIKIEPIKHMIPIAERGKDIIEPLISKQWFISVNKEGNSLTEKAIHLIKNGNLAVYPESAKKMFIQWLENLHDWNISRQIIWGHQMPVWYKNKNQENEEIHIGLNSPDGSEWERETDTFDTWFSSGQWPFSTLTSLGLVDINNPFESGFFPTHTMVMGRDILFFWACRMILLSAFRFNSLPWNNIYFTGLIRDKNGQKMSKSKGNGVEPTQMISKYGADALRMSFIASNKAGVDIKFDEKKVEGYGRFVNKLWNSAKLVESKCGNEFFLKSGKDDLRNLNLESSKWILSELVKYHLQFISEMEKYNLSASFEAAYRFTWDVFCSKYLEVIKTQFEESKENKKEIRSVLSFVFENVLLMNHSFAPFVTEEIWLRLNCFGSGKPLAENKFNQLNFDDYTGSLNQAFVIISAIRSHRKNLNINFKEVLSINIDFNICEEAKNILSHIAKSVIKKKLSKEEALTKPIGSGKLMIKCSPELKKQFLSQIEKQLTKIDLQIKSDQTKLDSDFKQKAPAELVKETEERLSINLSAKSTLLEELNLNKYPDNII